MTPTSATDHDGGAELDDAVAEPSAHLDGGAGRNQITDRKRCESQAGDRGGQPQAALEEQRDGQEERGQAAAEGKAGDDAEGEGAVAEQPQLDQRRAAADLDAPLEQHETGQDRRGGRQAGEGPPRPAGVRPLDEGVDEQHQGDGDDADAAEVEPPGRGRARLRREPPAGEQGQQADRQVDEEDGPPSQAEHIGLDEQAAEDDAGEGGGALDDAVGGEGPAALVGRERDLNDGQHLREHHGPGEALEDAGGDEQFRAGGQAAQHGRERESGHADQKDALATENVAEPAAGDEADGVGESVGGDDELDLGEGGVEVGLHRGQGEVDDEEVERAEEGGGEDDGEGQPAAEAGRGGGRRAGLRSARR